MTIPTLGSHDALIIVDVQNDFCPGGALPVPQCDTMIKVLNEWIAAAQSGGALIVASRDWHPPNHISFASEGGPWPAHCVQETTGAAFCDALDLPADALIISKGTDPGTDSYSAFASSDLANKLRNDDINSLWVGGVALEVCVKATILDALQEGFMVHLIPNGTEALDNESGQQAIDEIIAQGGLLAR